MSDIAEKRAALKRASHKNRPVKIEGLDEQLFIRPMSGKERADWSIPARSPDIETNMGTQLEAQCAIIAYTLVDEAGVRIFPDGDYEDIRSLPAQTIDYLSNEALIASGLKQESLPVAIKNSETGQSGASPTVSAG